MKKTKTKINSKEKKQKIGILVATTAAVLAISAGFIPNIATTAWAALVQCLPPPTTCSGTLLGDIITGTNGADTIVAMGGGDVVNAGSGNDNVAGGDGSDVINGGNGNDILNGGSGSDRINGGNGNDQMNGGSGDDLLTGGDGADHFDCGAGTDRITDFDETEGDTKAANCESF